MSGTIAEHETAVCAAITGADGAAFTIAQLKEMATKPAQYNEVQVLAKPAEALRYGGIGTLTQWTVLVRAVAQRAENAVTMRQRSGDALLDQVLTVAGVDTTNITRSVTDDPIGPDDGWFSGLSEFSYGH